MSSSISNEATEKFANLIATKLGIPSSIFTLDFITDGREYVLSFSIPPKNLEEIGKEHPKLRDVSKILENSSRVEPQTHVSKSSNVFDGGGYQRLTLRLNSEQFNNFLEKNNLAKPYSELLENERPEYKLKRTEALIEGGDKPSITIFSNLPKDDGVRAAVGYLYHFDNNIHAKTGWDEVKATHFVKFPINHDKTLDWHINAIKAATEEHGLQYPSNVDEKKIYELVKDGAASREERAKKAVENSEGNIKRIRYGIISDINSSMIKLGTGTEELPEKTNKVYQLMKRVNEYQNYSIENVRELSSQLEKALSEDKAKFAKNSPALKTLEELKGSFEKYLKTSGVQLPVKQAGNSRDASRMA